MSDMRNVTPGAEEPRSTGWTGGAWAHRGRNFPWLGVLLVLIGVALLVQVAVPNISAGTVLLLVLGIALVGSWLFGGSWLAAVAGLLLSGLAVGNLVDELGLYSGPGRTALSIAAAFVIIWLIKLLRHDRDTWPLWGVAIFGLIGLVQAAGQLTSIPEFGWFWPVMIIVVGLLLIISARRNPAGG
jgi:hypothetical protein